MLHCLLDHFVKADTVNKKRPIDSIDVFYRNTNIVQVKPVNQVSIHRHLLRRLHNDSRDLQVLSIFKRFVDPRLNNASVQALPCVFHLHDFLDSHVELFVF